MSTMQEKSVYWPVSRSYPTLQVVLGMDNGNARPGSQ